MQQKVDLWEEKAKSIYFILCPRPHEDRAGGVLGETRRCRGPASHLSEQ